MTAENQEILSGLKTAMEAELTGHQFYKNAAKNVSDAQAKAVLSEMAEEEMSHFKYLRHQYQSVLDQGGYDFSKKLAKKDHAPPSSPIFSEAIKARLKDAHYEISVLTIGMKLELDAITFYRSCAAKAESDQAREFYGELAVWEQGHYDAFERALVMLKEDYWQANNFVPM
jgi:rubrerythrin